MKKQLSVIIPAYNEEKAIEETIKGLKKELTKLDLDYEIIVINDGSTDKTKKILEKIDGIRIINHPYNKGYGAALKTGISQAKGNWILITDSDGTYPTESIPELLKYTNEYDMISGARQGTYKPFHGRPAKWILNKIASYLTNRKIPDLNCGLRMFKKNMALEFWHLFPAGFSFTTTLTIAALANNYSVKFVPIKYYKRKGKSSLKPYKSFIEFIALIIRMIMYFKPLKFLVPAGSLITGLGFFYIIYGLIKLQNITDGAMVLLLAGLQIIFIGLVADLIVKSRK